MDEEGLLVTQEKTYLTHMLELAGIVSPLKICQHYLYGVHFGMHTDHKSSMYLFDQKELNMRHKRWMEFIKEYEFELKYHPGKANVVLDALSWKTLSKAMFMMHEMSLCENFRDLSMKVTCLEDLVLLNHLEISCDL